MELCTAKLLWVTDTRRTFFTRVCETSHVAREIASIVPHSTNSPTIITNRGFPAQSSEHRVAETSCVDCCCGKNKLLLLFIMQIFYTRILHVDIPYIV